MNITAPDPTPAKGSDRDVENYIRDHFRGDAMQALATIGRVFGIPVHYVHPGTFEDVVGRPLTHDEQQRIAFYAEDYDEFMDNSGAAESTAYWVGEVLEKAGIEQAE